MIPNFDGKFLGWRPWNYEEKKTQRAVAVTGGKQEPHAKVSGWRAEVFFPYKLFEPLQQVPPKSGDKWRANFYRMDYDDNKKTGWDWARVGPSFHEYESFGTVEFQ